MPEDASDVTKRAGPVAPAAAVARPAALRGGDEVLDRLGDQDVVRAADVRRGGGRAPAPGRGGGGPGRRGRSRRGGAGGGGLGGGVWGRGGLPVVAHARRRYGRRAAPQLVLVLIR